MRALLFRPSEWTLRARLLAQLLALVAVACLVMGVATQVGLRAFLVHQLDERLGASGERQRVKIINNLRPAPAPEGQPQLFFGAGTQPGTVVLLLAAGMPPQAGLFNEKAEATELDLASPVVRTMAEIRPDEVPYTRELTGLGEYRLIARWIPEASGLLVVGLPLKDMNDTLGSAALIMLGVAALALVLTGLAGEWIIRYTLQPLRRVAGTASRVSELPLERGEVALSERVPEADTNPRTEVGQVGLALNRMLGHIGNALAIRHASEMRVRKFVADASHELRTPLAAIRGYAELTRRSGDQVPPDIARAMDRVESESVRMTALVEDLLLLARLDAGRPLRRQPVDLTQLVVDSVSDAHVAGPDHKWRVQVPDEPVTVLGDDLRLRQVLANLLANARTHTPSGSTVIVGITEEGDDQVLLTVSDDGPGIPPDLMPEVFERFARGDSSRSRAAGSTGLGLSIVAAVVAAHGGHVSVRSRPGHTEFVVRLPASS